MFKSALLSIVLILFSFHVFSLELPLIQVSDNSEDSLQTKKISPRDKSVAEQVQFLPNVNISSGSNRPRFIQIRGIGETSQFERSQFNAVGIFYEGIDLSEEASTLPLLGYESTKLNYGSQFLNWGAKAYAGSIEVKSLIDKENNSKSFRLVTGSYATASGSLGLVKSKANNSQIFNIGYHHSDGYFKNIYLNKPTNAQNEFSSVLGFKYNLGQTRLRQHFIIINHRNGYDSWHFTPSYKTISDHPGQDLHRVIGHSTHLQQHFAHFKLESLSTFTFTRQLESFDEDWGNNTYWNSIPGWNANYNYFASYLRHRTKSQQKIQLNFKHLGAFGLHLQYYNEDQEIESYKNNLLRKINTPNFTSWNHAVFQHHSWQRGAWNLFEQIRLEAQSIELKNTAQHTKDSFSPALGIHVGFNYSPTHRLAQEFSLTRSYRAGGYNTNLDTPYSFQPETLLNANYSTQLKSFNQQLTLNFYFYQTHNQQVRVSKQQDASDPNSFVFFTANNKAGYYSYGSEISWQYKLKHFNLLLDGGLAQGKYNDYFLAEKSLKGRDISQLPKWSYRARIEYHQNSSSYFIESLGKARYYHSISHDFQSPSYSLLNIGASYRYKSHSLSLEVNNIFNQKQILKAFYFANEPPDWKEKYYAQLGPPRMIYLKLNYEL